jgi:hypothetical protein
MAAQHGVTARWVLRHGIWNSPGPLKLTLTAGSYGLAKMAEDLRAGPRGLPAHLGLRDGVWPC